MAGHLNQSLAKPHYDELTKPVLEYLTETLEFLSHDQYGLKLADGLHAEITATIKGMSSEFQDEFIKELEELKKKLRILGAGKNRPKGAWKRLRNRFWCKLHRQGAQTSLLLCRSRHVEVHCRG